MKRKARAFCPYCGSAISKRQEEDVLRDYCQRCRTYFYENPLPVASAVVVAERRILLVKRRNQPYRGQWCTPTGFAEIGESIEAAALRELEEETGIQGKVVSLVDVDSCNNYYYGDLLFITFEVEQSGGALRPGSDTTAVKYFPVAEIPKLAFRSNQKAIAAYVRGKADSWAIVDSFARTTGLLQQPSAKGNLLSDRLIVVIEQNADQIAELWVREVTAAHSTPFYHRFDQARLFRRIRRVISQFGKWLSGFYDDDDIRDFFVQIGKERRQEGFTLGELLSALSIIKKHIWEYALSRGMWRKTLDMYAALELDRRIVVFFDRAAFYLARGYEGER